MMPKGLYKRIIDVEQKVRDFDDTIFKIEIWEQKNNIEECIKKLFEKSVISKSRNLLRPFSSSLGFNI